MLCNLAGRKGTQTVAHACCLRVSRQLKGTGDGESSGGIVTAAVPSRGFSSPAALGAASGWRERRQVGPRAMLRWGPGRCLRGSIALRAFPCLPFKPQKPPVCHSQLDRRGMFGRRADPGNALMSDRLSHKCLSATTARPIVRPVD